MSKNVSAPVHSVHFYDQHEALIERLRGIVASGLEMGNAIIIVATADHRRQLVKALEKRGVDVRAAENAGRFIPCDASETLDTFMVKGMPDRKRFMQSVGSLLNEAKLAARGAGQGLTVFGEMVAVLWEQGNQKGALALEAIWNDVLNDRAFHLHCAYPRWQFANEQDQTGITSICGHHSHVINPKYSVPAKSIQ